MTQEDKILWLEDKLNIIENIVNYNDPPGKTLKKLKFIFTYCKF